MRPAVAPSPEPKLDARRNLQNQSLMPIDTVASALDGRTQVDTSGATNWNLAFRVFQQCARTPERLALSADGVELTYAALAARASRLAALLQEHAIGRHSRVGILGSRSLVAVEAVLGATWAGCTYVPLGLKWPAARLLSVLAHCPLDAVIVDRAGLVRLTPELRAAIRLVFAPTHDHTIGVLDAPSDVLPAPGDGMSGEVPAPTVVAPADPAYIVFTSGTTGQPKGVIAPVDSVTAYLCALALRKELTADDRASQFTELIFDPAVGEIFLPWYAGASLHVVAPISQVSPARFIRSHRLTIWGSTPSAIAWMRDTRSLQPGAFPTLRYSSFGGEPLPHASVVAWQAAAPNSAIDNLYGPTEATVDCIGQRIEPGCTPIVTPGRGILAIGRPHPGTELAILGPDLSALPADAPGQLAIAGIQLTHGYLGAPELTAERFPVIDGKRWYLTGDIAVQDADGIFHYLGRADNQIKYQGHRDELEEIEAHVRSIAQTTEVAVLAWPMENGVARAIVCFLAGGTMAATEIRAALRSRLPAHMVPSVFHRLDRLPLSASGKVDRQALVARIESAGERNDVATGA